MKVEIERIYPLSPMQQGMLFHWLLDNQSPTYHERKIFTLEGDIQPTLLEKSLNRLVEKYEVLRTRFVHEKVPRPMQIVLKNVKFPLRFHDYSQLLPPEKETQLQTFEENQENKRFNLVKEMPLQVSLLKLEKNRYKLYWTYHHIIMDGWCSGIVFKELLQVYRGLQKGEFYQSSPSKPYRHYIEWLEKQDKKKGMKAWSQYLSGFETPTNLPHLQPPAANSFLIGSSSLLVGEELSAQLDQLTRAMGITQNTLFQVLWSLLLQRYNNTNDSLFGIVVSGRPPEIEAVDQMVGLFINTLPLRVKSKNNETLSQLLRRIQEQSGRFNNHGHLPLAEIQADHLLKNQLIRHLFVFENYPLEKELDQLSLERDGFAVTHIAGREQTNYDLIVGVSPGSSVNIKFTYNANVYDQNYIRQIAAHFQQLIEQAVRNINIPLQDLDLLTLPDKQQLLYDFNDTQTLYPSQKTIHQLFEEQAARTPHHIAAVSSPNWITYARLDTQSTHLAGQLKSKGLCPGHIAAIMTERSIDMLTGILGILKTGAAYMPIDPDYPQDRVDFMMADSNAKVLLKDVGNRLACSSPSDQAPSTPQLATSPAYIMYTSGSTGLPKGIIINHQSAVRLVKNTNYINFQQDDRILQTGAIVFDAVTFEMWGALLNGLSLYLTDDHTLLDANKLARFLKSNQITILWLTSALFNRLSHQDPAMFSPLRVLLVGGDVLNPGRINRVRRECKDLKIINGYGPTENTTFSTTYLIDRDFQENIPIGKPIANTTAYILDRVGCLQPVGATGELCFSGDGLSRGYLNNPELTAEKFYRSHKTNMSYIFYKTGDLARWLPDGNIEFLGRIDDQVKIRGFRIEPGEIQNRVLQYEGIKEALVTVHTDQTGEKSLCAYAVGDFEPNALKEFLAQSLPDYMIPGHFIQIEKFPLTVNGKINRSALPKPQYTDNSLTFNAPENKNQETLQQIWSQVLGIPKNKISTTANFFDLGGHSLKAMLLVSEIRKTFNVDFPLSRVFSEPTIEELAGFIKKADKANYQDIKPAEKRTHYPQSSAQKRLFFLDHFEEIGTSYNIPSRLDVNADDNVHELETIFKTLIRRHEALRTSFQSIGGQPVQIIHDAADFKIEEYESISDFIRPFNLSRAPLLRAGFVKNPQGREELGREELMVDMHHIITDGTSNQILIAEFMTLYDDPRAQLPSLKLQYKDFSQWRNSPQQKDSINQQETFWLRELSENGAPPVLNLPTDYPRPEMQRFEGASVDFRLSDALSRTLFDIAAESNATLYMTILSIYTILLSKLSGREDIVVGTPIAARSHSDLQNIIGMFVNTLAIRNFPEAGKTFNAYLKEVKERTLEAYENQDYQFEDLVDKVTQRRDTSRNPLFDVMFNLLNQSDFNSGSTAAVTNPEQDSFVHKESTSKFDLNLTAVNMGNRLFFNLQYCTKLFKASTIERFINYFKKIIEELTIKKSTELSQIEIITTEEKQEILKLSRGVYQQLDTSETIHHWFQKQTAKTPDHIAVYAPSPSSGMPSLTYNQLNQRANQLARLLQQKGVRQDSIVALMVERSIEMIIGIFGIMKAGGAYLPIDAEYPEERKNYMLLDSGVKLLLQYGVEMEPGSLPGDVEIIDLENRDIYRGDTGNLDNNRQNGGSGLAYVIYTSGSTGKPKGVMVEHTNMVNLISFQYQHTNIDNSKILQFSTISFDASIHEILSALLSGGTIVLIDKETRSDIPRLLSLIAEHQIKTVFLPISLLKIIFKEEEYIKRFPLCIRHIQTAGEQVIVGKNFKKYLKEKSIYLHNHYGPSETHVATTLTIDPRGVIPQLPTIGRPISNTGIYILDKAQQPVPVGVAGELYISGAQVGRGYLGREELTAQRFMENPFVPGERMYRTGDLARWATEEIEFLGRLDYQVKIRGFRVELGEIENMLLNHPSIKEAVVIAGERKGDKYLCAYFASEENLAGPRVREYLSATFPDYMIPAYFVPMQKIPHTPSGKINRRALPEPGFDTLTEEYTPPKNATEEALVEVWSDVLAVDKKRIAGTSNFFELGGHSLKAIQLAAKIQRTLEVNLPLKEIFKHATIRTMADRIGEMLPRRHFAIEPAEEKEYYPVSSVQKRLYILQQIQPSGTVYNMPSAVKLTGRLDLVKLEKAFFRLIHRHQNLRTSFHLIAGEPVQVIHNKVDFKIETLTVEHPRPFNLKEAPLMRAAVKKISPEEHILFIDTHHIISDGVTTAILTRDFTALYNNEAPPQLKHRYIDYSERQNRREINGELDKQETYWLQQFQEPVPRLKLPLDFTRPPTFQGATLRFSLGAEESAAINRAANREGVTLYMYLSAIFSVFLSRQGGCDDVVVCTPVAGRGHADLENIAGMFVNTLPLRYFPEREKPFDQFLQEVKNRALEAFQNQDYPLEKLVEHINNDDFLNILFALQNADMPVLEIPGLKLEPVARQSHTARFDLSLTASENEDNLYFNMVYSTDLFAAETAQRMRDRFLVLTRSILAADTGARIKDFDYLPPADKTLLHQLNNTHGDFPADKTLHQLLDEQARKTPEAVAILDWKPENHSLTYRELNTLSDLLAGALLEAGVQTGTITALIADISPKTMTAIAGIMKSGAVYLPIDPGFPEQRIEYMLKDSVAQVLVTTRRIFNESFPAYNVVNNVIKKVLYLEDYSQDCTDVSKPVVYKASAVPGDFAYALYTSGSTGRPKGVLITHANAVNHLWGMKTRYRFDESMRHILLAPLFFDPSIRQIFLPLITGGKLLPVPREVIIGIHQLPAILESCKIDVLNAVPSLVKAILDHMEEENIENKLTLKYAILGGEAFPGTLLARLQKLSGIEKIINVYGPTEATIDHITYECGEKCGAGESQPVIPIGLPLLNCGVLILDKINHRLCPGIPGEIYLTGKGVGAGYLNRQELTSELFVDNPFEPGEKMYRTGDLGRVSLSTGNIEFLGRIDGQVKIRGQRVELEEIENRLLKHEAIKEAVVTAGGDSENKQLHAYIVSVPGLRPKTGELQEFLALQLPNFMIPSSFTGLEQLPFTPNNKIDRKALPDPGIQQTSIYKEPRNITEEKLAAIWSDVLKEPSLSGADIGIDDDFFQLGGHSLKAAKLVSRISKTFAVEFPLSRVFAEPTIRAAAEFIGAAKKQLYEKIKRTAKKEYYPLSSAQKRLFFLDRFENMGTGYNIPRVFKAKGKPDVKRFTRVFAALVARHDILRTSFHMVEDTPVQRVHEPDEVDFRVDYFELGADKSNRHFFRTFDLSRAPLLRVGIEKTSPDEFLLLIDMHHIIGDGTSSAILAEEFLQLFREEQPLNNQDLQYKDFAHWQNHLLESGGLKEQADYWQGIYPQGDEIPVLDIPADFPRPASISFQGDHYSVRLGSNDTSTFKTLGLSQGATLFMNLLAASNVLLYKYTGQEDIITGTTTAGRPHADLERIIGIFINQLALRNRPEGGKSYLEFLKEVKSHCIAAFENPDLPFEELVDLLNVERDMTRNPLFEFSLVVQNFAAFAGAINQDNGTDFTPVIPENKTAKFDLTITAYEDKDEIVLSFEYRTALFKRETIQRLAAHFLTVIRRVTFDPRLTIAETDILSDHEKQLLLHDFNNTHVPYPDNTTIQQLFSGQAIRTPNEIAVRDLTNSITYRRLDQKSTGLAHQLIDRGAGPATIIAIKMERSIEMVTAILGILKTGAAYLPIDTDSPPDRSDFMMRDSNALFMLTHGDIGPIGQIGPMGPIGPGNPAYVMYTSGTTGRPKGVVIPHRSVINISLWIAKTRNITTGTRVLQMADCTFDTSIEDMFGTLLQGGTLFPGSRQLGVDKEAFRAYVNEHQIEIINFVPTLVGELLDHEEKLATLRTVIVGGEKLTPPVRDRVLSKGYRLFNHYGPTEVTVDALACECFPGETIHIGKPVFNSRCYILDSNQHPVPIGVPGEICIAGDGVAPGYLNRPELTNEKFVEIEKEQASLFPTSFTPLYKTGDLGRWSVDGNVEFLGRMDQQVKINGQRIELGEIEAALLLWDGIEEVRVIFDSETLQLLAYFTHHPAYSISTGLKEFLALSLPHYMLPARFIPLEKIPLTANGKIDKNALPLPGESAGNISTYRAPATPVEKELVSIWQQLLGREVIGLEDDFFRLGGDSIKALQATSRMQRAGYKLEMKHLFRFPRISQLAPRVKPLERIPDQSPSTGTVLLSPIQARFFENPPAAPHHFNQSLMLHFDEPLEEDMLRAVFTHLQQHHDALRMTFSKKEDKIDQQNRDINLPLSLQVYDLGAGEEPESKANEIQASINLETGPLMKIALFNLEESSRLLIVIHHLVIDTVSWRILLEDINLLFRQYRDGQPLELPRKSDSYKSWAEQISYYSNSTAFLKEKEYWQQIESVDIPPIANDSNGKNLPGRSEKISFNLTEEETEQLLTNVNQAFGTEINDILLTALLLAINCCFGLNKTAVALEGHGREEIIGDMDISRTVGWFTSLFPVVLERVENNESNDLPRQIIAVKEHLHRVPRRGTGYGILRYLTDGENKEDIHFKLKPQISFNYLGQFDSDLEQGDFKRASESAGNNSNPDEAREYLLDVAGLITGKQLTISITFDPKRFTSPQVFADHYQTQLGRIINYCCSQPEKRLTPIDLTYPHLSMDQLEELTNQFTLRDIYPLSPMQEGMLFHSLIESDAPVYFEQISYRMKGRFDISLVRKSLDQLVKRHDILRTVFLPGDRNQDRPLQLVREECPPDFYYKDISTLNSKDKETFLKSFKEQDRGNHFNLSKGPLMRTAMIRLDEQEYDVTWSIHHILMDGWCNRILNSEFFEIYNSYRQKRKPRLLPVTPYRSYIQWLEEQDRQASRDYWSGYLEDFDHASGIPRFGFAAAKTGPKESRNVLFTMDKNRTAALLDLAARNHVTVNTVIQAAWSILLGVYNGSRDVVFGAVVSGRPAHIDGIETMVGLFINTIPVRIRYGEKTPFSQLLRQVQEDALEGAPYHYCSLADTQADSLLKQHLLDHILVFENFPGIDRIRQLITSESTNSQETGDDGLTLAGLESFSRNNYDFGIQAALTDQLAFRFNYDGNKFEEKTIRRIFGHLDTLFNQIMENESKTIEDFSLLSMKEKKEILVTFNNTEVQYPRHKTVTQLFHEQVSKTPEHIAIIGPAPRVAGPGPGNDSPITLTYRQLNEVTTRLAHVLIAKGVTPDSLVPILFEPTTTMVTAILAIMKAGAAFIPLEPLHPRERTAWMLEDSQADILLTGETFKEKISFDGEIVNCDDEILYNEVKNEIPEKNTPTDFLYIIYTSGTTGKPKGSLIRHENIINYVSWFTQAAALTSSDRALLTSSYAFDALYTQFYSSLLTGGQLHVIPRETFLLADRLLDYIEAHQITYTKTTPSLFNLFVNSPYFTAPKCRSLRFFMLGGEEINVKDVETVRRVCGDIRVMNHYGPTETTIGSVAHFIDFGQFDRFSAAPTIGSPIDNTRTYIVDNFSNPVPVGIPGELLLAGDGVGSGYLNRPELTAEKFMPCPFVKGEMLYRTGDLALFNPDGKIQFLGRLDHQVKIRGYRIELDEVKNHILKHNDVKDVLVVVKDNEKRGKFITAYFVSENNLSPKELKGFLAKDLPDYMLPSFFIPLEKIPLTRHNKVDRRALPEPDISTVERVAEAQEGETEEIIAGIWSDLLGVEKENIGADTNFFDLGGHSLTAIRLVSKLHRELNVNVPLAEVFKQTTVRELANLIKETEESRFLSITKAEEKEYYPLSSAQKRIFILHRAQDNSRVFNMPRMVVLEGELREDQLENAFKQLIQRHDVFRTSFGIIDNEPVQRIHEFVEFKIELKDTAHFVRPFDLSRPPLMRAGLLKIGKNKHLLMVDMHHIISDGVSREIVVRELEIFYNSQSLPRLAIQYRDFSEWQNKLFQRGDIKKQEEYWLDQFSGSIPLLELPCDNPRPRTRSFAGDSVIFEIEKAETDQLKALAAREKTTLFILLLTIYNILLAKLSGQEDIVTGTVIAGRRHADLEPLVGMFANMLALRNFPTAEKIFRSFLKEVTAGTLAAFENQDYQFEQLVRDLSYKSDRGRHPLFDAGFQFQGKEPGEIVSESAGGAIKISPYHHQGEVTVQVDITIHGGEGPGNLVFRIDYSTALFNRATIEGFAKCFREAVSSVLSNPDQQLKTIEIIPETEREKILSIIEKDNQTIQTDFDFG